MSLKLLSALLALGVGLGFVSRCPADDDEDQGTAIGVQVANNEDLGRPIVQSVFDNSPADKAGIKTNDVLVKIGDVEVKDVQAVVKAVAKHKSGAKVKIVLQRDGKEMTVEATVVKREDIFKKE